MTATVLIGLGSNLRHGTHGAPPAVLRAAVRALAGAELRIIACSGIYATKPMGPRQPRFANAVIRGETSLLPEELLIKFKALERFFGRRSGRRWGPRVLDLDLLAYGHLKTARPRLTLPHAGLPQRPFVLWPARDVWPDWRHPQTGRTISQMAAHRGGRASIRPIGSF